MNTIKKLKNLKRDTTSSQLSEIISNVLENSTTDVEADNLLDDISRKGRLPSWKSTDIYFPVRHLFEHTDDVMKGVNTFCELEGKTILEVMKEQQATEPTILQELIKLIVGISIHSAVIEIKQFIRGDEYE